MATLGTARPAAWTEAEQKQLEQLARRYPSSEHSLVTQCAKIAAGLPRKSIRDVGARLRLLALDPLATAQPARPGTTAARGALAPVRGPREDRGGAAGRARERRVARA